MPYLVYIRLKGMLVSYQYFEKCPSQFAILDKCQILLEYRETAVEQVRGLSMSGCQKSNIPWIPELAKKIQESHLSFP